jgi:hypothetical protein
MLSVPDAFVFLDDYLFSDRRKNTLPRQRRRREPKVMTSALPRGTLFDRRRLSYAAVFPCAAR